MLTNWNDSGESSVGWIGWFGDMSLFIIMFIFRIRSDRRFQEPMEPSEKKFEMGEKPPFALSRRRRGGGGDIAEGREETFHERAFPKELDSLDL